MTTKQTKSDFAANAARRLRAVEHSLDETIADTCLLVHDLTRHRAGAGFAPQAGHQAFLSIQLAQAAMAEARTQMIAAHDRLAREARVMGVPLTAGGPFEDKPEPGATGVSDATASAAA